MQQHHGAADLAVLHRQGIAAEAHTTGRLPAPSIQLKRPGASSPSNLRDSANSDHAPAARKQKRRKAPRRCMLSMRSSTPASVTDRVRFIAIRGHCGLVYTLERRGSSRARRARRVRSGVRYASGLPRGRHPSGARWAGGGPSAAIAAHVAPSAWRIHPAGGVRGHT